MVLAPVHIGGNPETGRAGICERCRHVSEDKISVLAKASKLSWSQGLDTELGFFVGLSLTVF